MELCSSPGSCTLHVHDYHYDVESTNDHNMLELKVHLIFKSQSCSNLTVVTVQILGLGVTDPGFHRGSLEKRIHRHLEFLRNRNTEDVEWERGLDHWEANVQAKSVRLVHFKGCQIQWPSASSIAGVIRNIETKRNKKVSSVRHSIHSDPPSKLKHCRLIGLRLKIRPFGCWCHRQCRQTGTTCRS